MKHCIYFLLFCISSGLGMNNCRAQQTMNAKTYDRFVKEYKINEKAPDKAVIMRHDTMVHPLAIASSFFVKQRVYPNEDAVRLIQELNPNIDMNAEANVVSGDTRLIWPNYPVPNEKVLYEFRMTYRNDSLPNANLNQAFKNACDAFNQIFQRLTVPEDEIGKKYYDSLAFFNNKILPHINSSAETISRLQMSYFNTELMALNNTFTALRKARVMSRGTVNSHETASYIIADFYEIANPVRVMKRSLYTEKTSRIGNSIEDKKSYEFIFFDNLKTTPFACNLYIYGKDENGNRKKDPEMESYDVWVGDKMSYMTRINGSAPESYGFTKMGNPASTLPFNIGLGKWVVVMKKQGTDGVYLFKEISIISEKEFEPNDPNARKVCYPLN